MAASPALPPLTATLYDRLASGTPFAVPGLGVLERHHRPSQVEEVQGIRHLLPPRDTVRFTPDADAAPVELGDPALAEALEMLAARIRDVLAATGTARVTGVGVFRDHEGGLAFEPDQALADAVNLRYAGLKSIPLGGSAPAAPEPEAPQIAPAVTAEPLPEPPAPPVPEAESGAETPSEPEPAPAPEADELGSATDPEADEPEAPPFAAESDPDEAVAEGDPASGSTDEPEPFGPEGDEPEASDPEPFESGDPDEPAAPVDADASGSEEPALQTLAAEVYRPEAAGYPAGSEAESAPDGFADPTGEEDPADPAGAEPPSYHDAPVPEAQTPPDPSSGFELPPAPPVRALDDFSDLIFPADLDAPAAEPAPEPDGDLEGLDLGAIGLDLDAIEPLDAGATEPALETEDPEPLQDPEASEETPPPDPLPLADELVPEDLSTALADELAAGDPPITLEDEPPSFEELPAAEDEPRSALEHASTEGAVWLTAPVDLQGKASEADALDGAEAGTAPDDEAVELSSEDADEPLEIAKDLEESNVEDLDADPSEPEGEYAAASPFAPDPSVWSAEAPGDGDEGDEPFEPVADLDDAEEGASDAGLRGPVEISDDEAEPAWAPTERALAAATSPEWPPDDSEPDEPAPLSPEALEGPAPEAAAFAPLDDAEDPLQDLFPDEPDEEIWSPADEPPTPLGDTAQDPIEDAEFSVLPATPDALADRLAAEDAPGRAFAAPLAPPQDPPADVTEAPAVTVAEALAAAPPEPPAPQAPRLKMEPLLFDEEPEPGRGAWVWVVVIVAILALVIAAFVLAPRFLERDDTAVPDEPVVETSGFDAEDDSTALPLAPPSAAPEPDAEAPNEATAETEAPVLDEAVTTAGEAVQAGASAGGVPAVTDRLRGPGGIDFRQGGFTWVVASVPSREAANQIAARYRRAGYLADVFPGSRQGTLTFRVGLGHFATREASNAARSALPADTTRGVWRLELGI